MIVNTIKFDTRTVINKFTSTGEEFQLTVNINNTGVWTVFGWSTPQKFKVIEQAETIALRAIEVLYCSQPRIIYSPAITHSILDPNEKEI